MNTHYNKDKNHFKLLLESLFYNKYFYIFYNVLFLILAIITNDYKRVFFTAYFFILFSYFIHKWSHYVPIFNKIHLLHHTKKINKYIICEIIELFFNLLFIGGGIVIPMSLYLKKHFTTPFNEYAILLYTLIYTLQHMVVYHLLKVPTHTRHHDADKAQNEDIDYNEKVFNFGPDSIDVLLGTKKNLQKFENMDPLIPVIIVLMLFLFYNYDSKYDIIKWLKSKI